MLKFTGLYWFGVGCKSLRCPRVEQEPDSVQKLISSLQGVGGKMSCSLGSERGFNSQC